MGSYEISESGKSMKYYEVKTFDIQLTPELITKLSKTIPVESNSKGWGEPHRLSYKGEDFELCQYYGFEFSLDSEKERNVLRKWIELELVWGD